jgi:EF hand
VSENRLQRCGDSPASHAAGDRAAWRGSAALTREPAFRMRRFAHEGVDVRGNVARTDDSGWTTAHEEEMTMTRLIALIAATLLAATAMAGDKEKDMKSSSATFESLDKNADSQISKTEAAADKMLSDSFAAADTNGDGYLSKSEYMARTKS